MQTWDVNVRVNLTLEYDDDRSQRPGDVKQDARMLLEDFERWQGDLHGWVVEVLSVGRAGLIEEG